MAVNDTVELAIRGTVAGQTHVITHHFRYQEVTGSEAGLITDWETNLKNSYRAIFPSSDNPVLTVAARQVCGTLPLRAPAESSAAPTAGTRSVTAMGQRAPAWLALVVAERTAFAGRRRRGRNFFGGVYEGDMNGEIFATGDTEHLWTAVSAYATALLARYQLTTGTSTTYKLVVHSKKLAAIPGTQCQDSSTPVTALQLRPAIGTMRSRRPGSGT